AGEAFSILSASGPLSGLRPRPPDPLHQLRLAGRDHPRPLREVEIVELRVFGDSLPVGLAHPLIPWVAKDARWMRRRDHLDDSPIARLIPQNAAAPIENSRPLVAPVVRVKADDAVASECIQRAVTGSNNDARAFAIGAF